MAWEQGYVMWTRFQ